MTKTMKELEAIFESGEPVSFDELVALPSMPILLDIPPETESTAQAVERGQVKQRATGEVEVVPPVIDELRVGDEIELPDGRVDIITWVHPKGKRVATGRNKNRVYYSLAKAKKLRGSIIAKKMNDDRAKSPDKRGSGVSPVEMPTEVQIPDIPGFSLYPHQLENIAFLRKYGRGIIADEMGLGKSVTAAVAISKPAVIVCPALLKMNWQREVSRWRPELSVSVINGSNPAKLDRASRDADVVIINYDILWKHWKWLHGRNNSTIIADEAQYLKSLQPKWDIKTKSLVAYKGTSRRARAFYELHWGVPHVLLLTGTPIMNRTKELFPLLHLIDCQEWRNYKEYAIRYCGAYLATIGYKQMLKDDGCTNTAELHGRINSKYMMRHTKEAELKNLPPKSRNTIVVSLTKEYAREYRAATNDFIRWVAKKSKDPEAVSKVMRAPILAKLTALRGIAASGKAQATVQHIVTHFASTERPLVVMGVHREAFNLIEQGILEANESYERDKSAGKLPPIPRPIRYAKIVGGVAASKRQRNVDDFQAGKIDVMLYSIPIATGTTLTRAQEMLFFERMWRPSDQLQAEDRCHRIGQENHVTITYLDADGTLDSKMAMLLKSKAKTAAAVIDGVDLDDEGAAALVSGEMFDTNGQDEVIAEIVRSLLHPNRRTVDIVPSIEPMFADDAEWVDDFESPAIGYDDADPESAYNKMVDAGLIRGSWGDPT